MWDCLSEALEPTQGSELAPRQEKEEEAEEAEETDDEQQEKTREASKSQQAAKAQGTISGSASATAQEKQEAG